MRKRSACAFLVRDDNQLMRILLLSRRLALAVILALPALLSLPAATLSQPWSEGAAVIPIPPPADGTADYLAYDNHYSQSQHRGAIFSPDLVHWSDALAKIDFPAGLCHGSFVQVT
jgi:hypothetical protein